MAEISLSVIIATLGRPSLRGTLASILGAGLLLRSDEAIVVADGKETGVEKICWDFSMKACIRLLETDASHDWGATQRRLGGVVATRSHLLYLDDDDAMAPGAPEVIRTSAKKSPGRVLLFRMRHSKHGVLWRTPQVKVNNLSTQNIVVPNEKSRLGTWGTRYAGDYDFISSTVKKFPSGEAGVVWCQEIIAEQNKFAVKP